MSAEGYDPEKKKAIEKQLMEKVTPNHCHLFVDYQFPNGFLAPSRECHALFYYYLIARRAWEADDENLLAYEGEKDSGIDYRQLFTSVATMYGVEPDGMAKCWELVDKQVFILGLPRLPDEERYRFDRPIVVGVDK